MSNEGGPPTHIIDGRAYVTLTVYLERELELLRKLEVMWRRDAFVMKKLREYVDANFDPSMMGPTLDDLRHELGVDDQNPQ